ncbi:MAG TPA: iron-containing redox enzyme family protein [Myxococcales bacterium]|nr:iron-containing redox enzyme family protein [Myxococcales bacterium]
MQLTPATELSERFLAAQREEFRAVAEHPFFTRFADEATPAQMRKGLLGFYPLIEAFPRHMAMVLSRIDAHARPRAAEARDWLMKNIGVEEKHREWWIDCGVPLGLKPPDFAGHRPTPQIEAHQHFLWRIVREGSVAEAVAALNYAVEGATGEWTRRMRSATRARFEKLGIVFDPHTLRWFDAHADYDDKHPAEALEVVKIFADDEPSMLRAAAAAVRSLEYYRMALDDALVT